MLRAGVFFSGRGGPERSGAERRHCVECRRTDDRLRPRKKLRQQARKLHHVRLRLRLRVVADRATRAHAHPE